MRISNLSGQFFYPAVAIILVNGCLLSRYFLLAGILLLYWVIRCLALHKWWILLVIVIAIGYFWPVRQALNAPYQEKEIDVKGYVYPDTVRINGSQAHFQIKTASGKLLVTLSLQNKEEEQLLKDGALISGNGTWTNGDQVRNDNGFNQRLYLKQHHLRGRVYLSKYQLQRVHYPLTAVSLQLSFLRERLVERVQSVFPNRVAKYFSGLILGYQLEQNDLQNYRSLGIVHLFSLSGTHVISLILCLRYFCLRLGLLRENLWWVECSLLLFYFGLTGGLISVLRSSLQIEIGQLPHSYCRQLTDSDKWSLALLIGLLYMPVLLCTAQGLLTYGLSLALMIVRDLNVSLYLRPLMLSFAGLPLVTRFFYEVPLLSAFFNLIFMPVFSLLIPILLVLGMIVLVIPFMAPILWPLDVLLDCLEKIIACCSQFSLTLTLGVLPVFILVLWLISWFLWPKKGYYLGLISLIFISLVIYPACNPFGRIVFIDVGQGDSILIQLPYQRGTYLIDTGGKVHFPNQTKWAVAKEKKQAEYTVIPYLKSLGIRRIDALFLTHADADHMGDMDVVAKVFQPRHIYYPAGCEDKPGFQKKMAQFAQVQPILAPQEIAAPGFMLKLIEPHEPGKGDNDHSLVIQCQMGGLNFLFTGDLGQPGEEKLLQNEPQLKTDVLKVGHHGSKHSSSAAFIQTIQPKIGIISCGRHNRFHHPHQEVLDCLEKNQVKILRTDEMGQIQFLFCDRQWIGIETGGH